MTYSAIDQLTFDTVFAGRVRACCTEQADHFKDDTRAAIAALAADITRGDGTKVLTFVRLAAAAPGLADKATLPDGVDQAKVTDADILSLVQADWPTVAGLFYDADGSARS